MLREEGIQRVDMSDNDLFKEVTHLPHGEVDYFVVDPSPPPAADPPQRRVSDTWIGQVKEGGGEGRVVTQVHPSGNRLAFLRA